MTPQLKRWLAEGPYVGSRHAVYAGSHSAWSVAINESGAQVGVGVASDPEAAEHAALEDYARSIFVPGPALEHGRKVLGLPKKARSA